MGIGGGPADTANPPEPNALLTRYTLPWVAAVLVAFAPTGQEPT